MIRYCRFTGLTLVFLWSALTCVAQSTDTVQTKQVQIVHADKLRVKSLDTTSLRMLVGNVQLKQDSTLFFCDSAVLFTERNHLRAFGNIHIEQPDSVHAYANRLEYSGNKKIARLLGNGRLVDKSAQVLSDNMEYDTENDIGTYTNGGQVIADSTILTSQRATYYTETSDVYFKGNVVVVDSQFLLTGDTLRYNTKSKTAWFFQSTTIEHDSSQILCQSGWYRTDDGLASFGKNTVIYNDPQTLYADSLYYDRERGLGFAFKRFNWVDTAMQTVIRGTEATYFENEQAIRAFQFPLLVHNMDGDSLFLRAEELLSAETKEGTKWFAAWYKARMYKSDFQAVCDSLFYSFEDSVFRMYYDPILWSEKSEMQGDTLYVEMKNDEIDRTLFLENASIISQSKGKVFDQIYGRFITGYFKEGDLHRVLAEVNAESLYFAQNEEETAYIGANRASSNRMWVYLRNNEVKRISFIDKPTVRFTPLSELPSTEYFLKDFAWNHELRPKDKFDLY